MKSNVLASRSHAVTQSRSHAVTQSRSHAVTQSRSHAVTQSRRTKKIKFFIFLVLITILNFHTNAQSLFNVINPTSITMDSSDNSRLLNLTNDLNTKEIKLVRIGDFRQMTNNQGRINLNFPYFNTNITAEALRISNNDSTYIWNGEIFGTHTGNMGYINIDSTYGAWFHVDNRTFELMPFMPEYYTLRELKQVDNSFNCINNISEQVDSCDIPFDPCKVNIDVLVLIAQDAQAWLVKNYVTYKINKFGVRTYNTTGVKLYLNLITNFANQAFANSDITNKTLNFIFEDYTINYPTPKITSVILDNIRQSVLLRKNFHGADLAVVLYKSGDGYAGLADGHFDPTLGLDNPKIALVDPEYCNADQYTLVHELGHLFGASHEAFFDGVACHRAHRIISGTNTGNNDWITVMHYGSLHDIRKNPDIRILHFSNPNINYNGYNTGTHEENNAVIVNNASCTIANYNTRTTSFDIIITNDNNICRGSYYPNGLQSAIIPASNTPVGTTYTYEWKWNYNGDFTNNPGTYIGNTQNVGFNFPSGNYLFVQLKVVSSTGITVIKIKRLELYDYPLCPKKGPKTIGSRILNPNLIIENQMSIAPNPTSDFVNIKWYLNDVENVTISIINLLGKVIQQNEVINKLEKWNDFEFDLNHLESGNYIVKINSSNISISQKLIIIR
jgi:Secretion system C-terminal sorting domain/Metallo-peptidase family M12B Reprolysin-like